MTKEQQAICDILVIIDEIWSEIYDWNSDCMRRQSDQFARLDQFVRGLTVE